MYNINIYFNIYICREFNQFLARISNRIERVLTTQFSLIKIEFLKHGKRICIKYLPCE